MKISRLIVFLFLGFTVIPVFSSERNHVLILHSYHENLPWSQGLMKGFHSVFDKTDMALELHIEYLDDIRNRHADILNYFEALYQAKYRSVPLKAVITTDDPALDFVLARRDKLFPNIPLIFCAPNNFTDKRIGEHSNITGIAENPDIRSSVELIRRIHPNTQKIGIIADGSPSTMHIFEMFKQVEKEFGISFFMLRNESLDAVKSELRSLPAETPIIFTVFLKDKAGRTYTNNLKILEDLTKLCELPFYTLKYIDVGHGAVGGAVVSEEMMAKVAAEMTIDILKGKAAKDIPIIYDTPSIFRFDYNCLKKIGIDEKSLPRNSDIINRPFPFYHEYTGLVWIIIVCFILLAGLVVLLVLDILRRRRKEVNMRQTIVESEEKYRGLFESSRLGIAFSNKNGVIEEVNPAFAQMLGYRVEEMAGMKYTQFTPEKWYEIERKIVREQS